MQEEDRNGKTVHGKKGSYSNLSYLGAGGMKVVYNATDDHQGNEVVVVFPTEYMPNTDILQDISYHGKIVIAMQKELALLKKITTTKQPHSIIRYIDESKNGQYFGVLEKGGDKDILKKCKRQPLSQSEIIKISADVLHGLDFLHRQQPSIIHRDIKPQNILFKKDGCFKIIQ